MAWASHLLVFLPLATGQQIYISTQGGHLGQLCSHSCPSPTFRNTPFSFTQTETVRTATAATITTFPKYASIRSAVQQLESSLSTTSWGNWSPESAISTDNGEEYNAVMWSELWNTASITSFRRGLYSTTVTPSPVSSSELVLPPPRYFNPSEVLGVPHDFILGVASSAAQIEGAVADEGRSPAVTDVNFDTISPAPDGPQADNYVADENYYLFKQDINRIAALGVRYYSFSISWTRILPFALPGTPVNAPGLKHYDELINYAISRGVQPIVTLLHFDIPLQFLGPTPSRSANLLERLSVAYQNGDFEDAWVNYGKIVMTHFADRVPVWVTINEPQLGAASGPAIDHIVKGHARLWHYYRQELRGKGKLTMKMGALPYLPLNPSEKLDTAATKHVNDLNFGPWLNPLALGIDYPDAYKQTVQDYVPLSKDDLKYLGGTMDIVSYDGYQAFAAAWVTDIHTCAANNSTTNPLYPSCVELTPLTRNGWLMGQHTDSLSSITTSYVRTQLNYMWNTWKKPVLVSEFGIAELASGQISFTLPEIQYDITRSDYYISYINEILKAIWHDGVNVLGVLAWSAIDDWEFGTYDQRFGLQYNNRTTQKRSYRRSFFDMVDFVESRRL